MSRLTLRVPQDVIDNLDALASLDPEHDRSTVARIALRTGLQAMLAHHATDLKRAGLATKGDRPPQAFEPVPMSMDDTIERTEYSDAAAPSPIEAFEQRAAKIADQPLRRTDVTPNFKGDTK